MLGPSSPVSRRTAPVVKSMTVEEKGWANAAHAICEHGMQVAPRRVVEHVGTHGRLRLARRFGIS